MPIVRLDHDPNQGPVDLPEAEILDLERMGFSVTRVGKARETSESSQAQSGKGK